MKQMITNNSMKDILAKKLKDEQTYFTRSDIRIEKVKENKRVTKWTVYVKDYNHCKFTLTLGIEQDQFWAYRCGKYVACVTGVEFMSDDETFIEWYKDADEAITDALIYIGYYMGTRF